jgi:uncharacterized OsmC-like protein
MNSVISKVFDTLGSDISTHFDSAQYRPLDDRSPIIERSRDVFKLVTKTLHKRGVTFNPSKPFAQNHRISGRTELGNLLSGHHTSDITICTEVHMDTDALRSLQAPIKEHYRQTPDAALITLRAQGQVGEGVTCSVDTGRALVEAGLHPGTGGSGLSVCSGDMLLQALVACAGVTLGAVATALGIELKDARVEAEGDLDFRGTLGVAKEVPVGFQAIRLHFVLDTNASEEQLASLLKLTERYCVVYQTLAKSPMLEVSRVRS